MNTRLPHWPTEFPEILPIEVLCRNLCIIVAILTFLCYLRVPSWRNPSLQSSFLTSLFHKLTQEREHVTRHLVSISFTCTYAMPSPYLYWLCPPWDNLKITAFPSTLLTRMCESTTLPVGGDIQCGFTAGSGSYEIIKSYRWKTQKCLQAFRTYSFPLSPNPGLFSNGYYNKISQTG